MTAPDLDRNLEALLRSCVQCGLCLPHCATWLATGSEVQSPRGRLVLLGESLGPARPDDSFLAAFDTCIGCRACETACPSGVPFSLLERGHDLAFRRATAGGAVPGFLLRRLDRRSWLAVLRRAAGSARALLRAMFGRYWRRKLEGLPLMRLLGTTPTAPAGDADLVLELDHLTGLTGSWRAPRPGDGRAGPVVVFRGCANEGLLPGSARRVRELLRSAGHDVVTADGQECCGALAAHTGRPGRAAGLQRTNRAALAATAPSDAPVVVEAAGCSLALRDAGGDLGSRVRDATAVLAAADLPPLGPLPLRVAVHDPCLLRHGQGEVAAPRALLGRVPGLTVLEPEEAEVCCGSGGAWGLRHPELAAELGRRKARLLAATGADLVVTTNPGCLGQIADGLALEAADLPILPLSDLVWYAAARARQPSP